ncbi:DUF4926 domain-containing protein [Methylobacterium radiodurans]|uniref:DUF4926 domain-containing protein n=1 Tax=Methylobacterium radiodurans TaxID=2202828 RepID=A0A2U8W0Q8_9HYPH|nr:DUF4926 domain-containing protein [Methylobacterium radiodurans]AWN39042.1 DUF4926 domain-containing protein [Methylobacterium radiodurans]
MSVEVLYHWREERPEAPFRELDEARLLADAVTLDGDTIAAWTIGTIVGIWRNGEAYEVEFAEPMGALCTVEAGHLAYAGRSAP